MFENKPYVIILTCILQLFLHSCILPSVHTCMQINIQKIDKILQVEIKLSVLKFMCLGQITSDLKGNSGRKKLSSNERA